MYFTQILHNTYLNWFPISLSIELYKFSSSSRKTQKFLTETIVSKFLPLSLQIFLYYHSLFFCLLLILFAVTDYLCPGSLPLVYHCPSNSLMEVKILISHCILCVKPSSPTFFLLISNACTHYILIPMLSPQS